MKKISCNVIKDLIPLYVDDVVSEETKELVDEHISSCESCRGEVESMGKKVVIPTQSDDMRIKRFKRKLNKKKIITVCLSSVFTLLIGIVIFCYVAFWGFPMNYDEALVLVTLTEDRDTPPTPFTKFSLYEIEIVSKDCVSYTREYQLDENGSQIGEVVYLRKTYLAEPLFENINWSYKSNILVGDNYTITVVYNDKTVVYGVDEKGFYEQIENEKRYFAEIEGARITGLRLQD